MFCALEQSIAQQKGGVENLDSTVIYCTIMLTCVDKGSCPTRANLFWKKSIYTTEIINGTLCITRTRMDRAPMWFRNLRAKNLYVSKYKKMFITAIWYVRRLSLLHWFCFRWVYCPIVRFRKKIFLYNWYAFCVHGLHNRPVESTLYHIISNCRLNTEGKKQFCTTNRP